MDHRIEARKAAGILEKAKSFLDDDSMPVEIEYEDKVISQYTIQGHDTGPHSVIFRLAHKHTECLAPELCMVPAMKAGVPEQASCCGPKGCC